ncbi:aurora kinase-like [Notolabrus celidotus]|uniref:aurora kinase-like n=1 Tax=Notolabrus celidotus TaxID=1203425 RepID=UPI00148FD5D9|nr:aurora kinase-like [Notolabrus celidotus]
MPLLPNSVMSQYLTIHIFWYTVQDKSVNSVKSVKSVNSVKSVMARQVQPKCYIMTLLYCDMGMSAGKVILVDPPAAKQTGCSSSRSSSSSSSSSGSSGNSISRNSSSSNSSGSIKGSRWSSSSSSSSNSNSSGSIKGSRYSNSSRCSRCSTGTRCFICKNSSRLSSCSICSKCSSCSCSNNSICSSRCSTESKAASTRTSKNNFIGSESYYIKQKDSIFASTGARKRKVDDDQEGARKRQRTSTPDCPRLTPIVIGIKRKASEEDNTPCKRQRQEDSPSSPTTSSTTTKEETERLEFEAKYKELSPLGEGGYGFVYSGLRKADNVPVAIKHISKDNVKYEGVSVKGKMLPCEVAVMMRITKRVVGKSASISLLDFYDLDQELILVLERPDPSVDLFNYMKDRGGGLQEEEAKDIMRQLVKAAQELHLIKVFHRDIKLENILLETGTEVPRVRLIDFGVSCVTRKNSCYDIFHGASQHCPPEWYKTSMYRAGPTTVWQLGVALFEMLHGGAFDTLRFINNLMNIKELSQGCQDILHLCLNEDPHQRPSLEQLLLHPWLQQ